MAERGGDISQGPELAVVVKTLQERARTMVEMADGALFYYRSAVAYDEEAAAKFLKPEVAPLFEALLEKLEALADFTQQGIEGVFKELCAEKGIKLGQIGPAVRVALAGGTASPGIYEVIEALGKEETRKRLRRALEYVRG
ncbi:MAG: glutamyl-tRNA [Geobacteraceae bacterium]|nr:MAG: glutamyl-tRNA [Geobacteraceae bacterium]